MKLLRGAPKIFTHSKGGGEGALKKIVWLGDEL